jgi:hypothetical protein
MQVAVGVGFHRCHKVVIADVQRLSDSDGSAVALRLFTLSDSREQPAPSCFCGPTGSGAMRDVPLETHGPRRWQPFFTRVAVCGCYGFEVVRVTVSRYRHTGSVSKVR